MDYLDWQSDLSLEQVFNGAAPFSYPSILPEQRTFYLGRDKRDNRSVLMLRDCKDTKCVTPAEFNLQTRVNEYGGKPYWLFDSSLVFANQADQCLYRQEFSDVGIGKPQRISHKPDDTQRFMYTDVHELSSSDPLAIIERECSDLPHANNTMFIGVLATVDDEPKVLVSGADFYSNLVINQAKDKIAWVQWDHPNMPWDDTQLWTADIKLGDDGAILNNIFQINVSNPNQNDAGASICQLLFSNNNRLFFSADFSDSRHTDHASNYWNVHCYDFETREVSIVTQDKREYGYPHWVYGDHRIVQLTETELVTIASTPSGDELVLIDQGSLASRSLKIAGSPMTLQHLDSDGAGCCVFEKMPFDANPSLVQLDYSTKKNRVDYQTLIDSVEVNIEAGRAQAISFDSKDGASAHGFYYAPTNSAQQALTHNGVLPPLLVMVHGGPTARAYGHFDLQKQFWTSRGFAILDVNHRGSSGYGRQFRDALYGHWGEHDISDIVAGISHLVEQEKVDVNRICIRGKSAGGYAVLRALTEYPDVFRVGACYYGIGNLVTLSESTHKFEKHYTDRLVDEVFDAGLANTPSSRFYQRSPINKLDQLSSAMIVFQGRLDRVVPPSVAKEIIDVLVQANIDHEYVEYSNEGHGFKQPSNNIDAWQKELEFYRRVLGKPN